GRLDPMAHGQLLVLVGDECKKRDQYQNLSKEYRFRVIFGLQTDTYDMLGLVKNEVNTESIQKLSKEEIEEVATSFVGKYEQSYPPYSSKPVDGKPLFQWAREGRLDEIKIPTKLVEVMSLQVINHSTILGSELLDYLSENIQKVKGDFRQEAIQEKWDEVLSMYESTEFPVIEFKATVSSGTYVRSIANEMGQKLGTGAFALEIERLSFLRDSDQDTPVK
ncbi:hypothetical protein GF389_05690, partial [Candidatus Dojkabacteria bacterium]|nr:hypothetical protein [Candidatus Dojkabacteria bacterium]